jgi:hypothetical protein
LARTACSAIWYSLLIRTKPFHSQSRESPSYTMHNGVRRRPVVSFFGRVRSIPLMAAFAPHTAESASLRLWGCCHSPRDRARTAQPAEAWWMVMLLCLGLMCVARESEKREVCHKSRIQSKSCSCRCVERNVNRRMSSVNGGWMECASEHEIYPTTITKRNAGD